MRGAAGAGDDRLETARARLLRVFKEQIRGAVGGDDAGLEGNAEVLEDNGSGLHGGPVGIGTHDDADGDLLFAHLRIPALRSAASMVLASSMVMVIGPTPPGTGVIWPATSRQPA